MAGLLETIEAGARRLERAGAFYGHGTDNARDEAAALVLHALGLPPGGEGVDPGREVSGAERDAVEALLERRIREALPAAYLIGETTFAGLRMLADERALVPRSPIAELIVDGFEPWVPAGRLRRVLDLCTGGGCIAVATAVHLPGVAVDAADVSADALALARDNAARHDVLDRVRLVRSDLFDALAGERYDLIVSNPPYVARREYESLPAEYHREPELGLLAGETGLDLVLRILAAAPDHLAAGGRLICEVGSAAQALEKALPGTGFVWLEFQHGGEGVFLLEENALADASREARALLAGREYREEGR